jgi:hypothetical protein
MNYMLSIGDLLIRPKCLGFVEHEGVFVGSNSVITNTPDKGEHLSTIQEFAAGQPVRVQRTGANPNEIIARAKAILAKPRKYDPAIRNCQHTAAEVITGAAKSRQVMTVLLVVVCVAVVYVVGRSRR